MLPKKIYWMLGYNNLSLILEQERKHWLMKTDKKKQIQDRLTGDMFQGQIDNIGSDIIIESEKLPYDYSIISKINFVDENINRILNVSTSTFPYCSMVNGLMFARILSTNYQTIVNDETTRNNYRISFTNTTECIIPFAGSTNSSEVFADRWIKTNTNPKLLILDSNGNYTSEKSIEFNENVTGITYYYPLIESLQPLNLTQKDSTTYETDAVIDDGLIGYPLFWFTCDQTNIGPTLTFENNTNSRNEQIFFISNEGNSSIYNAKIYTGIDGTYNATPDGSVTSNYVIICHSKTEGAFSGSSTSDFNVELNPQTITVRHVDNQTDYIIPFDCDENTTIKMTKDLPWEYVDENTYKIVMSYFAQNCINGTSTNPLVSIFDVHFDESIPFVKTTTDVGYAGIRMSSGIPSSDIYDTFPHNLNQWGGLPTWIQDYGDGNVPEHLTMYAMHKTPSTTDDSVETFQAAGLILDPGKISNGEDNKDSIGRVYVISNDDTTYKNNATDQFPKPDRTAARICDIPTSVVQLSGLEGIAPTQVVDKKYVRTEVSYIEEDKDKLYNTLSTRWVRPTALTINGVPVYQEKGYSNKFAFETSTSGSSFLNTLNDVDLVYHNNFRYTINLNPKVNTTNVHIALITNGGSGYEIDDVGLIIVGGFSFEYIVTSVDESGAITEVTLSANEKEISLSNFDLPDIGTGVTDEYGSSPTTGNGRGLKVKLYIDRNHLESIKTSKGDIFPDLFALVRETTGLYVYNFIVSSEDGLTGTWVKNQCISEFEEYSSYKLYGGGVTLNESYINSIIPTIRELPVTYADDNEDLTNLTVLQTASFINVIKQNKTPVRGIVNANNDNAGNEKDTTTVDLCKLYCDGFDYAIAKVKNTKGIINTLNELNVLRYDSYILWRWDNPNDNTNRKFMYGIVYHGFNNLMTTDTTTMLPKNDLLYKNYVNTNPATTIVWDVDGVGPMTWVYNYDCLEYEQYRIDPETRDLHVTRTAMNYDMIDIRNNTTEKIVDSEGNLLFNIMTNNYRIINGTSPKDLTNRPIYSQPDFVQYNDLEIGNNIQRISNDHLPFGNWQLVFPRIQSFKMTNDNTNTSWIPVKMQTIRGRNIGDIGTVYDSSNNDVNAKTLIIDETDSDNVKIKIFNSNTKTWDTL